MNKLNKVYGIDSLYFFCESNEFYDELFLDILDQIETIKGNFEKKELEYENSDITININDIHLNFLGKSEGFYWFKDLNEYLKIGFKDSYKNRNLNDIRVQLQAIGIYSIGIYSLLNLVREVLLKGYISNDLLITRADLNCFINYDFSFITKEMFVTRKRKFSTISVIGNASKTQTLYVGKEPFKLRLYDKIEELKKSKKKELMYEYFLNNGLDTKKAIFNIEFQMHRTHLRAYKIQTVEQLLSHANRLFYNAMYEVRLIDTTSITAATLKHNKFQATSHPIWKEVQVNYDLKDFLQSSIPLERLKRKISIYDDNKFEYEFIALLRKALMNSLNLDDGYLSSLYLKAKDSLKKSTTNKHLKKLYTPVEIIHPDGSKENLRLFENGDLIKPISTYAVSQLQDYDLLLYLDKVQEKQHLSLKDKHIYDVAFKEAWKRELIPRVSISDSLKDRL